MIRIFSKLKVHFVSALPNISNVTPKISPMSSLLHSAIWQKRSQRKVLHQKMYSQSPISRFRHIWWIWMMAQNTSLPIASIMLYPSSIGNLQLSMYSFTLRELILLYNIGNQTDTEALVFTQQNSSNNSMNLSLAKSVKKGGSGVGGWSYVSPSSQSNNITWVVNGQLDDDKTTLQEFGHYFGLSHTFNNSTNATISNRELVARNFNEPLPRLSANCDNKGDFICNTPSDPRGNSNATVTNCTYFRTITDTNNDLFAPLVNNNLDYNFCPPYFFTNGQLDRI